MDNQPRPGSQTEDQITIEHSPLYLPVEDFQLLSTIDEAIAGARQQRSELKIDDRSKTNNNFWAGNQVDDSAIDKRYQMAHTNNVIYPDLENRIMLAAGRTPDIIILPPDRDQKNVEAARSLQAVMRERIDSSTIKRLIKDGLRNLHTDFIGIIKPRWNPLTKDFTFELLLSEDVYFGKGSKVPHDAYTIDGSDIVMQWVEEPVKVVMAKFPAKAQQLMQALATVNKDKNKLPSHIRYLEVHFTWYDEQGAPIEGVCWRYQNIILDKMRQPYYNYNGDNNFFDRPHKPFILFSYQNRGRSVYDTTTTVEQSVPLNRIINKRSRQITEINDRAVPKLAFKGNAINAEMARNISTSPKEAIVLTSDLDDINKAMALIPSQPANRMLFEDLLYMTGRVDTLMATHGTTRGETNDASGISKQISREGDLVTSDDLVDIVVERVVYEMTCWGIQFMRLFYDDDRDPVRLSDNDGAGDVVSLSRDTINTKIEVVVRASTTDKQTRRANALQLLQAKSIDPYTLFEDLDVPNPKERLKRLLAFQAGGGGGDTPPDFQQYLKVIGISLDEADEVAEQQRAQADITAIKNGQAPSGQPPTPSYVAEFIKFVNGDEFAQLSPDVQAGFQQFIAQMRQQAAQQPEQPPQQGSQPAAPGAVPAQAPPQPQPAPSSDMAALQNRMQQSAPGGGY